MKAVGYFVPGDIERAEALLDIESDPPAIGPRDLLVRVRAVSVNPLDTKLRASAKPAPGQPKILGYDAAGTVEAVGSDVSLFAVGDEVFYAGTVTRPGANCELHAVDERIVGRKPRSASWAEAAALPLTGLTAWELLFDSLRVPRDPSAAGSILIINGAGGVGSMLVQLCRRLTGLTIVATASRPESMAWAQKQGAHRVINHHQSLQEELARIGLPQVDYVASLAASDRNLAAFGDILKPRGSLALIDQVRSFDIVGLRQKSITIAWEGVFTRSIYETDDMIAQHRILEEISRLVDAGTISSTLTREMTPISAENLKRAHKQLESGSSIGKIVLSGF